MVQVGAEIVEADRAADVFPLKKGKIGFVAGGGNGEMATGADGIVEAVDGVPMGKAGYRLGDHDAPLSFEIRSR